jgi:hypothetical protein
MMARWLVLVVLASGCRQLWGLGGTPDLATDAPATIIDGPPDVMADARLCFGSFGDAPYCLLDTPTSDLTVTQATTINTTTSAFCLPAFAADCVIAAPHVQIQAALTATGNRPLVLIATQEIIVAGASSIDVASHHGGSRGAAATPTDCDIGHNPNASGGGQGGSLGAAGGDGGDGTGGGGRAGQTIVPLQLHAGCDGQDGGSNGGQNGVGGGAVYLIAGNDIAILGTVNASGSGGGGASGNIRGGGGGGSGGMIVLESPATFVGPDGAVIADGGGGGGGCAAAGSGQPGADPTTVSPATGGPGAPQSGDGGDGSGLTTPTGNAGTSSATGGGGGGGGGGAGVIKTLGSTIANMLAVSPSPS